MHSRCYAFVCCWGKNAPTDSLILTQASLENPSIGVHAPSILLSPLIANLYHTPNDPTPPASVLPNPRHTSVAAVDAVVPSPLLAMHDPCLSTGFSDLPAAPQLSSPC